MSNDKQNEATIGLGSSEWFGGGVSVLAALTGTIPAPVHHLRWGENIPKEVMTAMHKGQTAMLHDADGKPYALLLMDYYGTIREQRVDSPNVRDEPRAPLNVK